MLTYIFAFVKTIIAIILLMAYYSFLYLVSSILIFFDHLFFGGKVLLDSPTDVPKNEENIVRVSLKGKID